MSFYTSVVRYGNSILYRGYNEHGKKIYKREKNFKPMFFTACQQETGWKSLDGLNIAPIEMDNMRHAKQWLEENSDVSGRKIFGTKNYIHQYISQRFPRDIDFKREFIDVGTFDIETEYEDGFPHPGEASQRILSITYKSSKSKLYHVWGYGDFDTENSLIKPVRYYRCRDEASLLEKFLTFWADESHCPDVITGWNIRFFDVPYLVNRTAKILGVESIKRFSPWGMVDYRQITRQGRTEDAYDIKGIEQLDYLELFKKFGYSYGPQESYKLDHIANIVLGEKKLDFGEASDLNELHANDYQKFIDYNIKDVELIDRMEDKLGLISLCLTMAYKGGVNYEQVLGTVAIWDALIYRDLHAKRIAVPQNEESFKGAYPGGYVKEPHVGMHDWVCSFDLASLYPSIIMQYNMSPETILLDDEPGVNVESVLAGHIKNDTPNTALAVNGVRFDTKKLGIIPAIIQEIYNDRQTFKQAQLKAEQELELCGVKSEVYALEKRIAIAKNQQMALKILLNSLYGAMGNKWFRYFDMRIAEGITLTGQATIRWAENNLNDYLNKTLQTKKDYVVAIDTDSVYVCLDEFVKRLGPAKPVDFLDQVCSGALEGALTECYDRLFKTLGGIENKMVMEREVIADRGIWTAKKRYILNVHDNEGVRYAQPKLKIMGIEAIKSSTPAICRQALKDIFRRIIETDQETVQSDIANFKAAFKQASAEEVSFPRGVNNLNKWTDRETIYKKGTPIHIRGAILHNNMITKQKLNRSIQKITSGDKVKFTYLVKPNPIKENVIAFVDYLPRQFKLEKYIDYNLQFEKTFLGAIEPVLEAVGWTSEHEVSLEDFFV